MFIINKNRINIQLPIFIARLSVVSSIVLLTSCASEGNPEASSLDVELRIATSINPAINVAEGESYFQNRFGLSPEQIFWGEFHTHTNHSRDANACMTAHLEEMTPDDAYHYAKEIQKLDFLALSDHAEFVPLNKPGVDWNDNIADVWADLKARAIANNRENEFIVFHGYEYTNTYGYIEWPFYAGSYEGYGHKNVIFKAISNAPDRLSACNPEPIGPFANDPLLQVCEPDPDNYARTTADLFERLYDQEMGRQTTTGESQALTIIHTPSAIGEDLPPGEFDWEAHRTDWRNSSNHDYINSDFTRNIEICSKWGSSEGPAPLALGADPDEAVYQYQRGNRTQDQLSVTNTLYENWVVNGDREFIMSFTGSTDGHGGKPATLEHTCIKPTLFVDVDMKYQGTLTGVAAPSLSRNDLWSGVWQRHTLAVTTAPFIAEQRGCLERGRFGRCKKEGVLVEQRDPSRIPMLFSLETKGDHLLMGDEGLHDGTGTVHILAQVPDMVKISAIEILVDGVVRHIIEPGDFTTNENRIYVSVPLNFSTTEYNGRHFIYVRASIEEEVTEEKLCGRDALLGLLTCDNRSQLDYLERVGYVVTRGDAEYLLGKLWTSPVYIEASL